MTSSITSSPTADTAGRRRPWGVIAAVAVILLFVGWWPFFPGAFGSLGNSLGLGPYADGHEGLVHVDTGIYPDRSVHVLRITPRIVEGPDDLADQVSFHWCPSGSVGAVGADLTADCPSPGPVQGATIDDDGQVVLALPIDDTAIRIEGFVVTYRSGIRFGRQQTGSTIELFTSPR